MPLRWSKRYCCLLLLLFTAFGCAHKKGPHHAKTPTPAKTQILWDTWGVPHVFAPNDADLSYAFGYAQMQAHGDLILDLYALARGQAAEYWGAAYLLNDEMMATVSVPEQASAWYAALNPQTRERYDQFVAGLNEYARRFPDKISEKYRQVLPVRNTDPLAHSLRVIQYTFIAGPSFGQALAWKKQGSGDSSANATASAIFPPTPAPLPRAGSNGWAVAPKHTSGNNAYLLTNPHLPWPNQSATSGLYTFFEAQLVTEGMDSYGIAFVGFPYLGIAFNNHTGWTNTVNTYDGADLYELTLSTDGTSYLYDKEYLPLQETQKVLKVKQQDGSIRTIPLTVRTSIQGPRLVQKDNKALALRVAGLDLYGLPDQMWAMTKARNFSEFETALAMNQLPMFNVIYADGDGRIMYFYAAAEPRRPRGDWNYWQNIVPGNTSQTLWTETLAADELPRTVDPPNGWVQNANGAPWYTTFPRTVFPNAYPAYISPLPWGEIPFRPQHSVQSLVDNPGMTYTEFLALALSNRLEMADRVCEQLINSARLLGDDTANQAADVLEAWDHNTNVDSKGAVLFTLWYWTVQYENPFAVAWRWDDPRFTPAQISDPQAAVDALEEAAQKLVDRYGAMDVPWGQVYRITYGGKDLGAGAGYGTLGAFSQLGFREDDQNHLYYANQGDTYLAYIEFSNPPRAKVLLLYGNSTQPGSPFIGDQFELFNRKELREAWRTLPQIEANLSGVTEFPELQ